MKTITKQENHLSEHEIAFLSVLRDVFREEKTELPVLTQDGWQDVFRMAVQQKLLPVIWEGVYSRFDRESFPELYEECRKTVCKQVVRQIIKNRETEALLVFLQSRGLVPVMVKGFYCSQMYPNADERLCADTDFFIPSSEKQIYHKALTEYGMHTKLNEEQRQLEYEVTYYLKKADLTVELHTLLFDASDDILNTFFSDSLQHTIRIGSYVSLQPHDHMLYLLLHAFKHFVRSGVGIRQVCDIALWGMQYREQIDWSRLYCQCRSVRADIFAETVFRIGSEYLGFDCRFPFLPFSRTINLEPLTIDMLDGGVYGSVNDTRLHSAGVTLYAVLADREGRKRRRLSAVFPPLQQMKNTGSYLRKYPLLLPVAWTQRLLHYMGSLFDNKENSLSGSVRLARKRLSLLKYYYIIE